MPEWTFHKRIALDRFGQIGNVPFLLLKMFFHAWPSKTQSSKLHDYFFMREQIDHSSIRKNCESECLAPLFVSCVLWKGKIVRIENGERKTDYLASFFFFLKGVCLKIITQTRLLLGFILNISKFWNGSSPPDPCGLSFCFSRYTNR